MYMSDVCVICMLFIFIWADDNIETENNMVAEMKVICLVYRPWLMATDCWRQRTRISTWAL